MSDKNKKKLDPDIPETAPASESTEPLLEDQPTTSPDEVGSIRRVLQATKVNIQKALELLEHNDANPLIVAETLRRAKKHADSLADTDRIIEGVFNGQVMIGSDGKEYNVPANYASKSKLVEGDILKLTITRNGSFIFKQIGPIDRKQMRCTLEQDDVTHDWYAVAGKKRWRLLTASITYFHGEPGDEVVILVPTGSESHWAAVENTIKK